MTKRELPEGRKPLTTMESADLVLRMHKKLAAGFTAGDQIAVLEEMVKACKADAREAEAYAAELEAKLAKAVEALKDMCVEFRGYDLPYGSKAYTKATTTLVELSSVSCANLKGQDDE